MSAAILSFPQRDLGSGCIHIWPSDAGYDIGHESRSGDSWGCFASFPDASAAVTAAHRLNRQQFDGACHINIVHAPPVEEVF